MRIQFDHPATVRTAMQPGDAIEVASLTPELAMLIAATRADGQRVAHIVDTEDGEELAVVEPREEYAVTKGRRSGRRAAAVSG